MSGNGYPHIEVRDDGRPWLAGTQTKVIEVVLDRLAHHWDADEIHRQYPHLTHSQIYAALLYYHDHTEEMNRQIEDDLARVEQLEKELGDTSLRLKLLARSKAS